MHFTYLGHRAFVAFGVAVIGSLAVPTRGLPQANDGSGPSAEYRTVDTAIATTALHSGARLHGLPGYLGVNVQPDALGKLVVEGVEPESPAAKAGLKKGDIVVRLEKDSVGSASAFRETLQAFAPGDSINISILRNREPVSVKATLAATSRPIPLNQQKPTLGFEVGAAKAGGVPVTRIVPGSPAERAKLKVGEIILKIDGKQLSGPATLQEVLATKSPNDLVTLTLSLAGKSVDLEMPVGGEAVAGAGRAGQGGRGEGGGRGGQGGGRGGAGGGQRGGGGPLTLWRKNVLRYAVVGIEFPDNKHQAKVAKKDWAEALFSTGSYTKNSATGQPVFGSLNDYFLEQSSGAFHLEGKVFDWVEVKKKRGEYAEGSGTSNKSVLTTEALEKVVARDGKDALQDFDAIFFIYAGERAPTNRGALYYPHAGQVFSQGKRWPYALCAEGGSRMTSISGYCKEVAEMLGLPDLAARTENPGSEGLGTWCLLSDPSSGGRPQHLNPWAKEKLGWLKPTVINPAVKQKLALSPVEGSSRECFKIMIKGDGSEYLLLENRHKSGFDSGLAAEGLLIWRVTDDRPLLEESHGVAGAQGPRVLLDAVPFPSPANNSFTPFTTPSSRSPRGGGRSVFITEIRRLSDGRIGFEIGYEFL